MTTTTIIIIALFVVGLGAGIYWRLVVELRRIHREAAAWRQRFETLHDRESAKHSTLAVSRYVQRARARDRTLAALRDMRTQEAADAWHRGE